jgi:hypothetical protein
MIICPAINRRQAVEDRVLGSSASSLDAACRLKEKFGAQRWIPAAEPASWQPPQPREEPGGGGEHHVPAVATLPDFYSLQQSGGTLCSSSHALLLPTPRTRTAAGFDVFLSHAGPDKDKAAQLRNMLEGLGLTVFLDKDMRPGVAADAAMLSAANVAHVGLTLFSKEFAEREWPLRELKIFAARGSLLPALVPPLTYEAWKDCLGRAPLTDYVRLAALRTVMMIGSDRDVLTWQHKVCLGVVRVLVLKVRGGLPDRAWAGELRMRVQTAAERVVKFTELTVRETTALRAEASALALPWPSPPPFPNF